MTERKLRPEVVVPQSSARRARFGALLAGFIVIGAGMLDATIDQHRREERRVQYLIEDLQWRNAELQAEQQRLLDHIRDGERRPGANCR